MGDTRGHTESHGNFNNGICGECAEIGKQQGVRQERERIYAWLTVILPKDVFSTFGNLIRETLYGHSDHPTK